MPNILLADFGLFLGRFHPLLVHLPIGFLLLAVLLEWWPGDKLRPAIRISWALGALSAVAAAGCGWLLAAESSGGDTLFWHRWLGISVAVLAVAGIWVTREGGGKSKAYSTVTAVLLAIAGHQGGNLTHGSSYLVEHAPQAVQAIAGYERNPAADKDWSRANTDSINLYQSFLQPALEATCTKCHNADKQNGALRMDAPHLVFAGGDGGPIIAAGNPLESEWLRRVTLPQASVKSMPPQGDGWDYTTVKLLEYWIENGADTLALLDPANTPAEIKALLLRDHALDLRPKLFVETISAPALAPDKIAALEALNWAVSNLNPEGSAVEIRVAAGKTLGPDALQALATLAPQQTCYLNLGKLPLTDKDLTPLIELRNLNRLKLNGTRITNNTVKAMQALPYLESLNLYNTEVSDGIFEDLARYPGLKRVYLWQTNVTPAATTKFAADHPHLAIDTGFRFETPTTQNNSK